MDPRVKPAGDQYEWRMAQCASLIAPYEGRSVRMRRSKRAQLPGFQKQRKFVGSIDFAAFAVGDVNILRACAYHFDHFLNGLHCRIPAEGDAAL